MKKIKEKPTHSERIKEKAVSTPRELLHRGLDDGSERLRTQLRDTAQHGQADEYGGDTIEDTAARGLRRAEKELTRQRKKKSQEQPSEGGAPAADATEQKPSAIKGKDTTSAGPQPQTAAERGRQQARQIFGRYVQHCAAEGDAPVNQADAPGKRQPVRTALRVELARHSTEDAAAARRADALCVVRDGFRHAVQRVAAGKRLVKVEAAEQHPFAQLQVLGGRGMMGNQQRNSSFRRE